MKVKDLIKALLQCDHEAEAVLAMDQDPTGEKDNGEVAFVDLHEVERDQRFVRGPGAIGSWNYLGDVGIMGEGVPCVVLWSE